jgi:hypothetical protein
MRHVVAAAVMARLGSPDQPEPDVTRKTRPPAEYETKGSRRGLWALVTSALWKTTNPGG